MNITSIENIYENLAGITNITYALFAMCIMGAVIIRMSPKRSAPESLANLGLHFFFWVMLVYFGGLSAQPDPVGFIRVVANAFFCVAAAAILLGAAQDTFRTLGVRGIPAVSVLSLVCTSIIVCVRIKLAMVYHV